MGDTALVSMATTLTATDSPMLATDTDTTMARGPLTPMPGDTDTAAHTATATDTLMASKLPPNLVACHRTPMSSKYLSHSCWSIIIITVVTTTPKHCNMFGHKSFEF